MPIPAFDHNGVLPPRVGLPTNRANLSPYPCSSEEMVARFGTSLARCEILEGWLQMRAAMRRDGIVRGFQWIDGSFTEDKERLQSSPPNDIDVVSFIDPPAALLVQLNDPQAAKPAWVDRATAKPTYKVDHFPLNLNAPAEKLVDNARYWSSLFSHTRNDVWKGMLKVELNTAADDQAALQLLQTTKANLGAAAVNQPAQAAPNAQPPAVPAQP